MFSVPGWSVPAEVLKTQVATASKPSNDAPPQSVNDETTTGPTSKRALAHSNKRKHGKQKLVVNADNLAELWRKYIEGVEAPQTKEEKDAKTIIREKKRDKKRLKLQDGAATDESNVNLLPGNTAEGKESQEEKEVHKEEKMIVDGVDMSKLNKRARRALKKARWEAENPDKATSDTSKTSKANGSTLVAAQTTPGTMSNPPPAPSTLTALQSSMRQKLISSRFRHLNETLYTTPSSSSFDLFKQNPTFFSEYHEGFRRQVTAWPENPVDGFVKWIRERGMVGFRQDLGSQQKQFRKDTKGKKRKGGDQEEPQPELMDPNIEPLPRHHRSGLCTIVDLGCGEAQLATTLTKLPPSPPATKALNLRIHSYDLAATSPLVTVADITSLPLEEGSVDVAIFSLALMGINWIDFIEEAYRVLRWKGECWISEVGSRFAGLKSKRVAHSVGNRAKGKDNPKLKARKKQSDGGGASDSEGHEAIEEVTSMAQGSTDVSAFIEVLRRRGFLLKGEPDLGNKMFVRMQFIKALGPAVGKCKRGQNPDGPILERPKKFFDREVTEEVSVEDEARVLKPCVYKTR